MTIKHNEAIMVTKESPFHAKDSVLTYLWKSLVFHPGIMTLISLLVIVAFGLVFWKIKS
jgi:hypothetical protein